MTKRHATLRPGLLAALAMLATPGVAILPVPAMAVVDIAVEALYWEPTGQDVVLGSEATAAPFGNDILDFDSDVGFGISVTAAPWRLRYRDLSFEDDYNADHGLGSNFVVALDHPNNSYGPYQTVNAVGNIDLWMLDADYLIPINVASPATSLTAFVGLRYADYETALRANYDAGGQVVTRNADNSLFGVRVGLEAEHNITDALSFGAHGAISMLMGDSSFAQTESLSGFQRNLNLDATVPVVEAGIALNYKLSLAAYKLKLWVGYDMIEFNDVVIAQMFVDNLNTAAQLQDGVSAGFQGYTAGVMISF